MPAMSKKGAMKIMGSWGRKKKKTRVGVEMGVGGGTGSDIPALLALSSLQDTEGTDSGVSVSPSSPLSPPSPRCNSPCDLSPSSQDRQGCQAEMRSAGVDSAEASALLVNELFSDIIDQLDSPEAESAEVNNVTNGDDVKLAGDVRTSPDAASVNGVTEADGDTCDTDCLSEQGVSNAVLFKIDSCDSIASRSSDFDLAGDGESPACANESLTESVDATVSNGAETEEDEDDDTVPPLPERRLLPRKQVSFEDLCSGIADSLSPPPPPLPLAPPPGQTEGGRRPRSILKQVQYDGTVVPRTCDPPSSPQLHPPCPCPDVCLATAELRHVDIRPGPEPGSSVCVLLASYNLVICHHPECTSPNQDRPLLLCRQCDLDIHRKPEFSGHLVLDAPKKRKSYGTPVSSPRTPPPVLGVESGSESEPDEDSVDGIFLTRTDQCNTVRTPSQYEKRLKRKRVVKKRFSQQDGESVDVPEELMANLSDVEGEGRDTSNEVKSKDGGQGQNEGNDPGRPPVARRMSKVVSDQRHFTLRFSEREDDPDVEVVVADKAVQLSDALMPILNRRGLSLPNIHVFLADSKTPLPTSSNTSFLGGTTLYIAKKDDREAENRAKPSSSSSKQSSTKTSKSPARGGGRRDSLQGNSGGGLLEPPSKQRRASLQLPSLRDHLFPSAAQPRAQDEPFGSLRGRKGLAYLGDEAHSLPSVSPQGTLTLTEGKRTRTQGKLSALFSPVNKDREKQDQLTDILNSYTEKELPPLPNLLRLGREVFDESIFSTETHWSVVVENTSSLSKKQHDQQEAIWELLQTELSYIQALQVITQVFQNCLINVQESALLCEIDTDRLFSNVSEVLESNQKFWRDYLMTPLARARETGEPLNPSHMKGGFTKAFKGLFDKPYSRYCMEHKAAVDYMRAKYNENELFKTFVVWAEAQKQCKRLKLTDLLVKPVQRLTKYPLLLQAILRKTEEERQRRDLLEMIASVDNTCTYVNTRIRLALERERLEAIISKIEPLDAIDANTEECSKYIQEYNTNFNLRAPMPGCGEEQMRVLVIHSALRMKEAQTRMDVDCFLFTDLLLICKSNKRMDRYKITKPPMRLDRIIVQELKDRGSFLLIYINEYHVPIMALTFHGDQTGVKVWLERIKETQDKFHQARLEAAISAQPAVWGHSSVLEEVTYTPLTPAPTSRNTFVRLQSEESGEERFVPNIVTTVASPPGAEQGQGPNEGYRQGHGLDPPHGLGRGRAESCSDLVHSHRHDPDDPAGEGHRLTARDERSTASSPSRSPQFEHRRVGPSVSVPNVSEGLAPLHLPPEARSDLSPLPGEDVARSKVASRRVSRTEKRYHTADSIREMAREGRDTAIHKRLSWNLGAGEGGEEGGTQPPRLQAADSLRSLPSSSGVSSSGSLQHPPDLNDSDLGTVSPRPRPLPGPEGEAAEAAGGSLNAESRHSKSRSTSDLVTLLSELKTGEEQAGIVSVDLPAPTSRKRLSHAEILKMKQLLLNSNVEASEV